MVWTPIKGKGIKAAGGRKPASTPVRGKQGGKGDKKVRFELVSSKKFVMTLGDDGAVLVFMEGDAVMRRLFSPGPEAEQTKLMMDLFASEPRVPIYILIDTVDQSYVQQSLPPVSAFSIDKLIKRRLTRDFAATDIKGAIKIGRAKEGRKDWNYVFVSVPYTDPVGKWVDTLQELDNQLKGIFLLPVECQGFIDGLAKVLHNGPRSAPEWQMLVSHNKTGGFRQVVLRNGKMIFTRITQPIGEELPEILAGNVEQEIQGTTEYLKRLGFSDSSGFEVFIVVSEDMKKHIDLSKTSVTESHILSPHKVSELLGFKNATEPQDRYGDVVLATAFGISKKKSLKLQTPYISGLNNLYMLRTMARVAAALALPFALAYYGNIFLGISETRENVEYSQANEIKIKRKIDDLKKESESLPDEVAKINEVVSIYDYLSQGDRTPLAMSNLIQGVLTETVRVKEFVWDGLDIMSRAGAAKQQPQPGTPGKQAAPEVTVTANVEFTKGYEDTEKFVTLANSFLDNLKGALAGYDVNYTKVPGTFKENEVYELKFGDDKSVKKEEKNNVIELKIQGPAPEEKSDAATAQPKAGGGA